MSYQFGRNHGETRPVNLPSMLIFKKKKKFFEQFRVQGLNAI